VSGVFKVVPEAMQAFSEANKAAGDAITAAASADLPAALASVYAAIGPIGTPHFNPAITQALCHNVTGALACGQSHYGIADVTDASQAAFVAADTV
jgi:hypothetical protein